MATIIKFEIPDVVATFIKDVLKVEPKTYIQKEFVEPTIEKYKESLSKTRIEEAKVVVETEVAAVKTAMKVIVKNGVE